MVTRKKQRKTTTTLAKPDFSFCFDLLKLYIEYHKYLGHSPKVGQVKTAGTVFKVFIFFFFFLLLLNVGQMKTVCVFGGKINI